VRPFHLRLVAALGTEDHDFEEKGFADLGPMGTTLIDDPAICFSLRIVR
jgi:hypothetical protein